MFIFRFSFLEKGDRNIYVMGPWDVFLVIVTLCLSSPVWSDAPSTLRLVNLVYRHGDRSPAKTYPKNPNLVNETWPQGLGWLTSAGIRQQYSLGNFLRRRYNGFLNKTYINKEISVQSSDTERCLMSAYSNLAGLYPPSGDQVWNKAIPWQPIPVHTRPNNEDNSLNEGEACPRYDQIFNASLKSDAVRKEEKQNKVFYDFIVQKTGVVHETIRNIWEIADVLYCEKQHNVSWPSWVNDTVFNKLKSLEAWGFDLMFLGKEEQRLKGGPLLKEWIELAWNKTEDQSLATKMNMFSAHDTTVASVLSALGLYNKLSPPYTSTVFMELHQNTTGDFYVELYFRNKTSENPDDDTQPYPLTLPGCAFQCPIEQFVSLTKDVIPTDWKAECAIDGGGITNLQFNTATIIAVSIACGVILILVVIIMVMCCKRVRHRGGFGYKMTI